MPAQTIPASPETTATPAPWAALASMFLDRLQARRAYDADPAARDAEALSDDEMDALLDELAGRKMARQDARSDAPASRPAAEAAAQPLLPMGRLLLLLRLAASFGNIRAFEQLTAPRATTILADLAPDEASGIAALLDAGLLPEGWSVRDGANALRAAPGNRHLAICHHEGHTLSAFETARFQRRIHEALEVEAPLVILLPATLQLPPVLRRAMGPEQMQLAPLDRTILLRFLQERFGAVDLAALAAALPPDAALRHLDPSALLLASRAADAMAAARRIARNSAAVAAAGPRLRDLVGYGEAREAALSIIEDLAAWQQEALPWSDVCRGLLLCGPPGTGKTALARAMAREGGIGFVAASYADWQAQGHLGDFLAAMADSFASARRAAPAILFLDEIDAFQSRSAAGARAQTNSSYDAKAIAGLLQHLDGIMGREGVVVVAACNHPEQLDPAIRRAGRFDRIISLAPPAPADLALILRQHLGADLGDADLSRLARHAPGRTGADCAAAVREARSTARRQRRAMRLCPGRYG